MLKTSCPPKSGVRYSPVLYGWPKGMALPYFPPKNIHILKTEDCVWCQSWW